MKTNALHTARLSYSSVFFRPPLCPYVVSVALLFSIIHGLLLSNSWKFNLELPYQLAKSLTQAKPEIWLKLSCLSFWILPVIYRMTSYSKCV